MSPTENIALGRGGRSPRIFLGLTEVSGYYAQLRKGFAELGISCTHIPIQSHRFAYEEVEDLGWPARLARYFVKRRVSVPERARLRRTIWLVPVLITRMILFFWAVRRFDVFIMGGGSSFFRFLDLPMLRWLGRRVIYVLHGTDCRPAYLDGSFYQERHAESRQLDLEMPPLDKEFIDAYVTATAKRRRDVRRIEKHAEVVICGPGFAQLLEKPYINFAVIGIPFSPLADQIFHPRPVEGRVRVLHATSDMVGRGTRITRLLVHELQERGLPIDFIVMTGQPHAIVLQELRVCDFVIDGQWADTPMAGFATEAAQFGKPVVMGGYYADFVQRDMPQETIPPTCFTRPDQMKAMIEKLTLDEPYRKDSGARLKHFVSNSWTPRAVAEKYLRLLFAEAPKHWWCDPLVNLYIYGGGISLDRIRENVRAIVRRHGSRALCLDHNSELLRQLLEFAQVHDGS
jgi:hypothetical protein